MPAGWIRRASAGGVTLVAPDVASDKELIVAIVAVSGATTPEQAVQLAWQRYRVSPTPAVLMANELPPRDGWDEQKAFTLKPASDNAVLQIVALRHGTDWTVAITDGSVAAVEKRGAALRELLGTLRPAGYVKETFAKRAARPLTPQRIAELRHFIERGMRLFDVPGVGFALIDHNQIVYEGGIGVRELGNLALVDAHTYSW